MDMYDSVTPGSIPASAPAVMWYLDGPKSAWPAPAVAALGGTPNVGCTVLASTEGVVFDYESGNAGIEAVATACLLRLDRGLWSVVYSEKSDINLVTQGLRAKGVGLTPASSWPAPGVYLHAADPTGTPHLDVAWAPVQPVAVQDRWTADYDISSTYGGYPGPSGTATGDPTQSGASDMTDDQASQLQQVFNALPELVAQQQATWTWLGALQPGLAALVAGQGDAVAAIAAGVVAALPAGAQGGLSAADVTAAVRAAFTTSNVPVLGLAGQPPAA